MALVVVWHNHCLSYRFVKIWTFNKVNIRKKKNTGPLNQDFFISFGVEYSEAITDGWIYLS